MKLPKNIYALADLVGFIARQTSGYNKETMQGACFGVSTALADAINLFGFGRADVELCKKTHYMHAWTKVSFGERKPWRTAVIDLTFTQYDFDAPQVYVVDRVSRDFLRYMKTVARDPSASPADGIIFEGAEARIVMREQGINVSGFNAILKRLEGLA